MSKTNQQRVDANGRVHGISQTEISELLDSLIGETVTISVSCQPPDPDGEELPELRSIIVGDLMPSEESWVVVNGAGGCMTYFAAKHVAYIATVRVRRSVAMIACIL